MQDLCEKNDGIFFEGFPLGDSLGGEGKEEMEGRGGDGREGREGLAEMISKYSPSQSTLTKHLPTHLEEVGQGT